MEFQEQLDKLESLVDVLLVHKHAADGSVVVGVECVEDVMFDARLQRRIDKKAIEEAGMEKSK